MLAYVTAENIMKILFVKAYPSDRLSPATPLAATPRSGTVSIYAHLFKNAIAKKPFPQVGFASACCAENVPSPAMTINRQVDTLPSLNSRGTKLTGVKTQAIESKGTTKAVV
jgi:hypothetical protein